MINKTYTLEEMIERYAKEDNCFDDKGVNHEFDTSNGISADLKALLNSLINGNTANEDFDGLELIFEERREGHLLLCSCEKTSITKTGHSACSCGKSNFLTAYIEDDTKIFAGRSVYRVSETEDFIDYAIFNYNITYKYGKVIIEIMTPMYLKIDTFKVSLCEYYIKKDTGIWNVNIGSARYLVEECCLNDRIAMYSDSINLNALSNGTHAILNDIERKFGINIDFNNENTLSVALSEIHFRFKYKEHFLLDSHEISNCINRKVLSEITESYYGYKSRGDEPKIFETIKSLKEKLGDRELSDILEEFKEFVPDIHDLEMGIKKAQGIESLIDIIDFTDYVSKDEIGEYLKAFFRRTGELLKYQYVEALLNMYNDISESEKHISFSDFIMYIVRYANNEDKSFDDAVYGVRDVYKYIDSFKGAFSTSLHKKFKLKKSLNVDKYEFLEELSACSSFDSIYKKLIC